LAHPEQSSKRGSTSSPSKRALFIVLTDSPGGAERVAFGLARELARREDWAVEVMLACSSVPGSFTKAVLPPRVRVRYGPTRSPFLAFPLLPARLLLRRYDLVYTTHIYTNALVSLMRRARLIRPGRLVLRESMSLFDRFSGAKARLFRLLYRAYGGEDLLIAQTDYMAEHVRRRLPGKSLARLRTLGNPVDVDAIERARAEPLEAALRERLTGKRNILFCGRMVEFKRPDLALEAFRLLKEQGEQAQLVFLGTGPLEPSVRAQAASLGLADDVLFLGQRSNPYPVMAECDYGLVTSANEGFPNVILEMMASRVKGIVTTPCAGDLDRLTGVVVTHSHDAAEITAALKSMFASSSTSRRTYRTVSKRSTKAYVDILLGG
jgi:glycosyltransferase involved in cell wall biosynthesis